MTWRPLVIDALATSAELDDARADRLWRMSGAAELTDPDVATPVELVRRVRGLAAWLEAHGVDMAQRTHHAGLGLLTERAALLGLGRSGRESCGGASRLVRAVDGWLAVSLARPADAALVPAWLECDVEADAWATIERVLPTRSATEVCERAILLGLACAVVGETVVDAPAHAVELGGAPARDVRSVTVVNLASLWAGPLTAHLLGRAGADVIDVESTTRPDGARATPAFHRRLHTGHRSLSIDIESGDGREMLLETLSAADVVIEGSRPRALEQLGIDAAAVTTTGPQIWVSITGHGRRGHAARRVGFGDDCAAAGGLIGSVDGEPRFIADAVADPLTGLVAASVTLQLLDTGGRWMVDLPLAGVAATCRVGLSARER